MAQTPKPVILLAVADPGRDLPHVGQEFNRVIATLKPIGFQIEQLPYASRGTLLNALQEHRGRIAIFHFGGHANEKGLLLETDHGDELALAEALATVLSAQDSLKLLFLNGCSTEPQIKAFHQAGVPVIIGTRKPIPDIGASHFAEWFYRGLATGATIDQAFREAQGALGSAGGQVREVVKSDNVVREYQDGDLWVLSTKGEANKEWDFSHALKDPYFGLPRLPEINLPAKPYKHLSYFSEEDAELFFGRGWETRDLYFRVTTHSSDPILLLYGQSGVGKSSLLDAGLLPRLKARKSDPAQGIAGYEVKYARRDGTLGLLGTLNKAIGAPPEDWKKIEDQSGKALVVVLDQLEEAYTQGDKPQPELSELVDALEDVFSKPEVRPKGKLILSFRKEWVAEIKDALKPCANFYSDLPLLKPLGLEGITQAIVGPTTTERLRGRYRLTIDPSLPTEMAQDLLDHSSPIAPTLQLTLTKMWDRASQNPLEPPRFDNNRYREFKELGLGEILDQQLKELATTNPKEVESGLALDLLHFHTTDIGTAAQRSAEELLIEYGPERSEQIVMLVQESKNKYLLSDPPGGVLSGTRLSHDTLVPYIRSRFEQSELPGQRARKILVSRVMDWEGKHSGMPLDEYDLDLVMKGKVGMRDLTLSEKRLFEASEADVLKRLQQHKNNQRFRKMAIAGLGVLALLVSGLTWWSTVQASLYRIERKVLEDQRKQSLALKLADQADLQYQNSHLQKSLMLARQAYLEFPESLGQVPQPIERVLRKSLSAPLWYKRMDMYRDGSPLNGMALNSRARLLAIGDQFGQIRIWNLDHTNKPVGLLQDGSASVASLAISPDGKLLAAGGGGSEERSSNSEADSNCRSRDKFIRDKMYRIRVWEMAKPDAKPTIIEGHIAEVQALVFTPDSRRLISASADQTICIWDASSRRSVLLGTHSAGVNSLALSEDGRTLVSAGGAIEGKPKDAKIRIWDLGKNALVEPPLEGHDNTVWALALSKDGKTLVSSDLGGRILKWNLKESTAPIQVASLDTGPVRSLALFGEQWLISGDDSGVLRLWNLENPREFWPLGNMGARIHPLVASQNGDIIVSIDYSDNRKSQDRAQVRVWNQDVGAEPHSFESLELIADIAYYPSYPSKTSPNKGLLGMGGANGTKLWDTSKSGSKPRPLSSPQGFIAKVAFSGNGEFIASASTGGDVYVWKTSQLDQAPDVFTGHLTQVDQLVFDKTGKVLVSGSRDGAVWIWNPAKSEFPAIQLIRENAKEEQHTVRPMALSPNGQDLLVADEKIIHWWKLEQDKVPRKHGELQAGATALAISPDGYTLFSGSNETIYRWDLRQTKPESAKFATSQGTVRKLVLDREGRRLASSDAEGKVVVWDSATADQIDAIDAQPNSALAFRTDGQVLALAQASSRDVSETSSVLRFRYTVKGLADLVCKWVEFKCPNTPKD